MKPRKLPYAVRPGETIQELPCSELKLGLTPRCDNDGKPYPGQFNYRILDKDNQEVAAVSHVVGGGYSASLAPFPSTQRPTPTRKTITEVVVDVRKHLNKK